MSSNYYIFVVTGLDLILELEKHLFNYSRLIVLNFSLFSRAHFNFQSFHCHIFSQRF